MCKIQVLFLTIRVLSHRHPGTQIPHPDCTPTNSAQSEEHESKDLKRIRKGLQTGSMETALPPLGGQRPSSCPQSPAPGGGGLWTGFPHRGSLGLSLRPAPAWALLLMSSVGTLAPYAPEGPAPRVAYIRVCVGGEGEGRPGRERRERHRGRKTGRRKREKRRGGRKGKMDRARKERGDRGKEGSGDAEQREAATKTERN